ncbi:MAG: amino acid permease [Bacillota bacterium]
MGQSRPAAGLTVWQLVMLALGTVVGGSFFLGGAIVLQATGPSILIALALGGALVFLILRALAELTVGRPARGSFREYAEQAFGPAAGFVVGWVYWTGMMLAMSSEATAVAVFLQLWVAAPLWLLSGLVIVASREGCPPAGCQMPGYPYSTWTAIGLMVVIMASMPLVAGQAAGLLAGLALVGAFGLVYWVTRRRRAPTGETPGERIREERGAEDGPLPLA